MSPQIGAYEQKTTPEREEIILNNVSKFYGEVLGVNGVTLRVRPGVVSLVGPNGAGKTTLMNLVTGLIRPDRGEILVRGVSPGDPERLMRITGYATQYDAMPRGFSGFEFLAAWLELYGWRRADAEERAWQVLETLGMSEAAHRKMAAYSKGMRQRIRLAQALAHDPEVLVLDEPLNGLDPLVRLETIELFRRLAAGGRHVIISSHVLREVEAVSDQVILIANGAVAAEGEVRSVREEISELPSRFLVAGPDARRVASLLFLEDHIAGIETLEGEAGLMVMTRDRRAFAASITRIAATGCRIERVEPADQSVDALYGYLIEEGRR